MDAVMIGMIEVVDSHLEVDGFVRVECPWIQWQKSANLVLPLCIVGEPESTTLKKKA